jgi:hypothetical protein
MGISVLHLGITNSCVFRTYLIAIGSLLVACGTLGPGATSGDGRSHAAAGAAATLKATPTPPKPLLEVSTCRSSDLRAHTGFDGVGLGHYGVELVFVDHGATPCALRGFPASVRFFEASGHAVTEYPIALSNGGYMATYPNDGVELLPGLSDGGPHDRAIAGQTFLQLQLVNNLCGRATVKAVVVALSDGGVFRFDAGFAPDPYGDCVSPQQYPPMMSSFQVPPSR